MAIRRAPRVRRAIEKALIARDRMEIAAAERLLALLKVETPRKRAARPRQRQRQRAR